jgi:ribosomal RNA methyltransferase Nop2
LEDEDDELPG